MPANAAASLNVVSVMAQKHGSLLRVSTLVLFAFHYSTNTKLEEWVTALISLFFPLLSAIHGFSYTYKPVGTW